MKLQNMTVEFIRTGSSGERNEAIWEPVTDFFVSASRSGRLEEFFDLAGEQGWRIAKVIPVEISKFSNFDMTKRILVVFDRPTRKQKRRRK